MSSRSKAHRQALARRRADREWARIRGLLDSLYGSAADDPETGHLNLKTARVEVVRAFVFYLQGAIEELLRALLFHALASRGRRAAVRQRIALVKSLGAREVLDWCRGFGVIDSPVHQDLVELNRVRNVCAHHWVLDSYRVKRDKRSGRRTRTPTLQFRGRSLLKDRVLLESFCPTFGPIYLRLLGRVWRLQPPRGL